MHLGLKEKLLQLKRVCKKRSGMALANPKGEGLKVGAHHYRAYIGPACDYDLISAMVFNLLTCLGLKDSHRVLDVGCGS